MEPNLLLKLLVLIFLFQPFHNHLPLRGHPLCQNLVECHIQKVLLQERPVTARHQLLEIQWAYWQM